MSIDITLAVFVGTHSRYTYAYIEYIEHILDIYMYTYICMSIEITLAVFVGCIYRNHAT